MTRSRFIQGPAGPLDSRWHGPEHGHPVLLLHPHPAFGGSMGSRFTYDLAQALADDGYRVVRFDFRGVRRSAGEYDGGDGETEDALAAYDALRAETGEDPAVVGHSFGAGVAIRVAGRRPVAALVAVAPPRHVRGSDLHPIEDAPDASCPAEVVIGTEDALVPPADAEAVRAALPDCGRIHVLQGIGHFLDPEDNPRGIEAVRKALRRMLGP